MSCIPSNLANRVRFLTVPLSLTVNRALKHLALTASLAFILLSGASGCALVTRHYAEPCKSRAFIGANLEDYISSRFDRGAPVRMAIIPYSTPANLSFAGMERSGLGSQIAQRIQSELLPTGIVPIVEVFDRQDWPGKKDEFFSGNFTALRLARDAGYDLVVVGSMPSQKGLDNLTVRTKIIEVDSGITIFYGESSVHTNRPEWNSLQSSVWLDQKTPNQLFIPEMVDELCRCVVRGIKRADS
jgi:hypothetical protein